MADRRSLSTLKVKSLKLIQSLFVKYQTRRILLLITSAFFAITASTLSGQSQSGLIPLIPDQCPMIETAMAARYGDVVDLQATLEFFGEAGVPNTGNSVKKWDILINGFPLINIEKNYLTNLSVQGKDQKWYPTHIWRQAGGSKFELFEDAEYRTLATKLASGFSQKRAVSFTFNPSVLGTQPPMWAYASSDANGLKQVGNDQWWTKSPRYARLNIWVTKVHPREKYTVMKAPPSNAKGFDPGRDSIEIKSTSPSQNVTGSTTMVPFSWASSFDMNGKFCNPMTRYLGMKVGEIRKFGDDYIYELIKVTSPR